jgi:hypothetical protein
LGNRIVSGAGLGFDLSCLVAVAVFLAGCTTNTQSTAASPEMLRTPTAKVTLAINPAGGTSNEAGLPGQLGVLNGCVIAGDTPKAFVTLIFPRGTVYDARTSSVIFADGRHIRIGQQFLSSGYSETFNSAADASRSGWHAGCPLNVFYVNRMERQP